jgi:ElaB/YqjD/DUF883 family membrane-anchored ribosome-binding protein
MASYAKSADDITDDMKGAARAASGRVQEAASTLAETGRKVQENAQAVGENVKGAIDRSLKEQPLTTLAVAAAFGFVLGALWKSS